MVEGKEYALSGKGYLKQRESVFAFWPRFLCINFFQICALL